MFWSTLSVVASETWNDITCIWRFRDEPDLNLHILWQYSKAKHFTLVCKIFHSLHVHCMHRVRMHLENSWNPRISGVLFQGLEITWNWFFVLESPWFFIEQDWKILNEMKASENNCSWQVIRVLNSWNALKLVPRALLLLSCMSIEPLVHSECLVCACFQALIVWLVCMLQVNLWKEKSLKNHWTFAPNKMCTNPVNTVCAVYNSHEYSAIQYVSLVRVLIIIIIDQRALKRGDEAMLNRM